METCRICGARLFEGSEHCARCYAPVVPTESEITEAMIDVASAAGRRQPPTASTERWHAGERHTRARPAQVHSRWRSGVLSFSLPAKIAITLAVAVGVPFLAYSVASALAIGPIAIWTITVTPRALKDLWKRTRVA